MEKLPESEDIFIKKLNPEDSKEVVLMAFEELDRKLDIKRVQSLIKEFPGFAFFKEEKMIGFAYCLSFAPDVLELGNILIRKPFRNQGLGKKLLFSIEQEARVKWRAIILVNSLLCKHKDKRRADSFYKSLGYQNIFFY